MSGVVDNVSRFLSDSYQSGWGWVNGLDRQQWMMMLMATMVLGFLCMRGFGSRKHY